LSNTYSRKVTSEVHHIGIVAAEVVSVTPHPHGEKIYVAQIDLGDRGVQQVVFGGARMLRVGDIVPAAPPGARLPNGAKLRKEKFRGESSFGMLCSTTELGWTADGPDEVAVLGVAVSPGKSLDYEDFPLDLLTIDYMGKDLHAR
jgi:tRNA-binding EMAP/Myf-like protein